MRSTPLRLIPTVLLLVAAPALAQAPAPLPAPAADTLQSPEVLPDRRITFRLRAPKAAEVSVAGEWTRAGAPPNTPEKASKGADGVWSVTVGPVEPNIYIYSFTVDGMSVTDPLNPLVKLRARGQASMVEVPGGASSPMPWDMRDVPHGALTILTHASPVLGGASRQVFVYTPPGYDKAPAARLPVLYLLHGNNDLAAGWTMAGRAHLILDNLIADKKVARMIVVMPWGHALPFGAKPGAGQPTNNDVFAEYLLKDVVPLVQTRFRVAAGRRSHALVGLSMGGAQTLQIGLGHRDRFAWLGVFGAGMSAADVEAKFGKLLAQPVAGIASDRDKLALFYVGMGKEDGGLPRAKELTEALRARGVQVTYHETDGGHTYPVWRKLLTDVAPLLFR